MRSVQFVRIVAPIVVRKYLGIAVALCAPCPDLAAARAVVLHREVAAQAHKRRHSDRERAFPIFVWVHV